jgi:hypothetical protein
VLVFAVCFLGLQQVSLVLPAQTADKAVAALSKFSDQPLRCSAQIAKEIVQLRVKNVPLNVVRLKLAGVLEAKWVEHDGELVLERLPADARELDARQLQVRADAMKARAKKRAAEVKPWTPALTSASVAKVKAAAEAYSAAGLREMEDVNAKLAAARMSTPSYRAVLRLLPILATREAAALTFGDEIILSTRPTPMEKPLPSEANLILSTFNSEQRAWLDELAQQDATKTPLAFDARYGNSLAHGNADRLVVKLRRVYYADILLVIPYFVDANGWILAFNAGSLTPGPGPSDIAITVKGTLKIDPEVVEYRELTSNFGYGVTKLPSGADAGSLLEKWRERLVDPKKFEPHSFYGGRVLDQIGEAQHLNVIACIPDQAFTWRFYPVRDQQIDATETLRKMIADWSVDCRISDGWLEMKPTFGFMCRAERLVRTPLGSLLHHIIETKQVPLDSLAEYAHKQTGSLCLNSIDSDLVGIVPNIGGSYSPRERADPYRRAPLRFWGALSPEQRRSLLGGGTFTLAFLGDSAQRRLEELVFGWSPQIKGVLDMDGLSPPNATYLLGNIYSEPAESCPSGLPGAATISCIGSKVPLVIQVPADKEARSWQPSEPEMLGSYQNNPQAYSTEAQEGITYRLGGARLLTFTLRVSPRASMKFEMGEQGEQWSEPVPFDQLPAEVQTAMKNGLARAMLEKKPGASSPPPQPRHF